MGTRSALLCKTHGIMMDIATYMGGSISLKVVLLDNVKSLTTGGQEFNPEALDRCLLPWQEHLIRVKDPTDSETLGKVLREMTESNELKILILNYRENS